MRKMLSLVYKILFNKESLTLSGGLSDSRSVKLHLASAVRVKETTKLLRW